MMKNNSIDWTEVILEIKKLCTSELGAQQFDNFAPLSSPDAAITSFAQIDDFKSLLLMGNRPFMESLDLYYTWYNRLKKNAVMKTIELKDIRVFCTEILSLKDYFDQSDRNWPQQFSNQLFNADEPISAINQLITDEGNIRNDASEKLYSLFVEKKQLTSKVERTLEKIVKLHEMENIIQDKFVTDREGRMVIPVKSGMQHSVDGIIHATSHSRQTVYMEPQQIIPMNNRLKQVEQEIHDEVEVLLQQISSYLYSRLSDLEAAQATLLQCDQLFAKAKFCLLVNTTSPTFNESEINLKQTKHPLLVLKGDEVVANSVKLNDEHRILLLTGPNAGGKTILLKAVGLASEMARHGLPICAESGSTLPFFKELFVAVGDLQSVDENLSTFAGHLKVLNESLKAKGNDRLLLIDEICGSTDPEEGAALARSFITKYSENDCFAVITSHLSPLKTGWPKESKVINGSLEYDAKTGRPTYQFIMGIPGESLAIQTAIRVGVDQSIIDQAFEFLSPEVKEHQKKLVEAEEIKTQLVVAKQLLDDALKSAKQEKSKYHAMIEKFNKDKEKLMQAELQEAKLRVDDLIQKATVDKTFKKHETLIKMQAKLPKVVKASGSQNTDTPATVEQFLKAFPPGSKVFIETLGKDAVIQSKPNSKGEVSVLAGSMQLSIHWQLIKPPMKSQNPTGKILKKRGITHSPTDTDRVIDLRGLKTEDATIQLEAQLDTASLNEEDRVKVIHGHGTESLKRTIRQYLSRSVYVKKWSAGVSHNGGDGVTWVEL